MASPVRETRRAVWRYRRAGRLALSGGLFTLYVIGMFALGGAVHAHFFASRARAAARMPQKAAQKAGRPVQGSALLAGPLHTWTIGSTEDQVKRLEGIPRTVDPYPSLGPGAVRWSYWHWDSADDKKRDPTGPTFIDEIFFQGGRVVGYHDASDLLKVK